MRTIKDVSRLAGVSIRTLHYYDSIGLLSPAKEAESGYRLYDDTDLERLQQILLFRELQFPLKESIGAANQTAGAEKGTSGKPDRFCPWNHNDRSETIGIFSI